MKCANLPLDRSYCTWPPRDTCCTNITYWRRHQNMKFILGMILIYWWSLLKNFTCISLLRICKSWHTLCCQSNLPFDCKMYYMYVGPYCIITTVTICVNSIAPHIASLIQETCEILDIFWMSRMHWYNNNAMHIPLNVATNEEYTCSVDIVPVFCNLINVKH